MRRAAAAESAAKPVPKRTTVMGSGIETGAGGAGVAVGETGVDVGSTVSGAWVATVVAVGGTSVDVGGTSVAVGGTSVGTSVGCGVSVSAAGACAKTATGRGNVVNVSITNITAPERIKYNGLDFIMGDSPGWAINHK